MKFLLIGLLLAGSAWSQDYRFSDFATAEQKATFEYIQRPWGETDDVQKSFDYVETLLKTDKPSVDLLNTVNETLASHGLGSIRNILSFCTDGISGAFSQGSEIAGIKVAGEEWSEEAREKMNKGYSSKVVKTPFIEILLVSENPSICIRKEESYLSVVDVFNHELTHFIGGDTFGMMELIIKMEDISEYYEYSMSGAGGEMDAYKAGIGAETRFLSTLGIVNPAERYPFLNDAGVVTSDEDLREYLDKLYYPYYTEAEQLKSVLESAISMNDYRIALLRDREEAKDEVARLEKITAKLKTQMPK